MKKRQRKKEGKKLIKKESKRRALYWLSRLRTGTIGLCELTIDLVREDALRGKFSLADIGTSEKELEQFQMINGRRDAAKRWLGRLRTGTDLYKYAIDFIHKNALKGKFSLADIGTSEEELEQLRIKGAAKSWLDSLREGTDLYKYAIGFIREHAFKGKFSLADIGTSEEELSSFLRVKENDMNEQEVVDLMKSSRSEAEWGANCDKVKEACGGYPPFWYSAIVLSGILATTTASFGGSADIKVSAVR